MTRVAIVDTETTGLAVDDEPISVAVILVAVDEKGFAKSEIGRYYGTELPKRPIHPAAARVHGMTAKSLAGTSFDRRAIAVLLGQADVVVAHNARFDYRMVRQIHEEVVALPWRCSWRQFPWESTGGKKLDDICAQLEVTRSQPHNAMADAEALLACLQRRAGKTDRSKTYLGHLLGKAPFDAAQVSRPAGSLRRVGQSTSARPTQHPSTRGFLRGFANGFGKGVMSAIAKLIVSAVSGKRR